MNALERVLQDDLNRLVDRLAAVTVDGMLAECAERRPSVQARLDRAEARLSSVRQELLRGYCGVARSPRGVWRPLGDGRARRRSAVGAGLARGVIARRGAG